MSKGTVLLANTLEAYGRTFRKSEQERMFDLYEVLVPSQKPTTDDLLALAEGKDLTAVFTVWGSPAFPTAFWQAHPECRYFGHMAGSVKHFFPDDTPQYLLDHDITVVSGQYGLAINVAEATIGLMIALSRRWPELWMHTKLEKGWKPKGMAPEPQGLLGATVGLVSASVIGRLVTDLLKPYHCRILCYDPYLSEHEAGKMGVEKVDLDTVFSESDIVSMHHPQTPQTDRMIGREQFSKIKDGAVFINTARPRALDPDALLEAARENRFQIALDVTEPEPLPADHPLRDCPNVWILPHVAGLGVYGSFTCGDIVMESLDAFLQKQPLRWRYPVERLELMA